MLTQTFIAVLLTLGWSVARPAQQTPLPEVELRAAAPLRLPNVGGAFGVDCNSPAEWDDEGNLFVFTSLQRPYRTAGTSLFDLAPFVTPVFIEPRADVQGGQWLEATWRDDDGTLYGWYHNEPPNACGNSRLTAPRIGALISRDDGHTWRDLGIIITAPADALNCSSSNTYFGGGNGDFSVRLDQERQYFYFFISTYHRQVGEQGVAVARMRFADRAAPAGQVRKWRDGQWNEPGLGGRVTMTFPALIDWHRTNANAYWGPAVHYNTEVSQYVMLLNHAVDRNWAQEGIYVSFNARLDDPHGWSAPQRLPLNASFGQPLGWYPQVIGVNAGETDKTAGHTARLFISGQSLWEIIFHRTDNEPEPTFTAPERRPTTNGPMPIR